MSFKYIRWIRTAVPFVLASGLEAPSAFAGGPYLEQGKFVGTGWCKDNQGHTKSFDVSLAFVKGAYASSTTEKGGGATKSRTISESVDHGYGFFELTIGGKPYGRGYCTSLNCHIEQSTPGSSTEETLIFEGRDSESLTRIWSQKVDDILWACEDKLKAIRTNGAR